MVLARYFNKLGATGCLGNICLATGATAIPYTYGAEAGNDSEQYGNTSLYLSWGTNEAASGVHQVKFIKQCKENGRKIIVINTTPTPVSEFADLYLRRKPGTDAALALAIAHIMINMMSEMKIIRLIMSKVHFVQHLMKDYLR